MSGALFICVSCCFFFFNDTATTEIYTLSLHDALPICIPQCPGVECRWHRYAGSGITDRKSTRLNSSHLVISYAVFCLKKKTKKILSFLMLVAGWALALDDVLLLAA